MSQILCRALCRWRSTRRHLAPPETRIVMYVYVCYELFKVWQKRVAIKEGATDDTNSSEIKVISTILRSVSKFYDYKIENNALSVEK